MIILPYSVDVPLYRWPIANFVILGLMAVAFTVQGYMDESYLDELIEPWSLSSFLFSTWFHVNIIHLLVNGLFLWVFGNAVCAKIGNL